MFLGSDTVNIVRIVLDMMRVDFAIYDNSLVENNLDLVTRIIREYLVRDECYSSEVNQEIGEYMVTLIIPNRHLIIMNN